MHYPVAGVEVNFFVTLMAGFMIGVAFSTLSVSGAAFTSLFQTLIGVTTALQPINVLATLVASLVGLRTYLRERRVALPIAAFLLTGVAAGVVLGARAALLAFGKSFSHVYLGFMGDCSAHRKLHRSPHSEQSVAQGERSSEDGS